MKPGYSQHFKNIKTAKKNPPGKAPSQAMPKASAQTVDEVLKQMTFRRKKPKAGVPWGSVVFIFIGCLAAGYGYNRIDKVEAFLSKIEVQLIGSTHAEEKPSQTEAAREAKPAEAKTGKEKPTEGEKNTWTNEEISYFSKLNERKKELDQREKELGELEEELHKQKVEVEARIQKLEEIRKGIANVLKERVEVDQAKVDKLVEFYSNMKPKQAADIVTNIDEDLAVEILTKMKKKNAAEIMNLLKPEKAQVLSEKFAGYKRR